MWASSNEEIKYGVEDGDLLVCEGGDVGRAGIVRNPPPNTIIQNALHRVRSYQDNNLHFLMYVLEHAASQGWFEILCNRSTIAHFTGEKFGALRLPIPSPEEQQTIARFLDAQTAKLDTLVAKKRALIDKLKEKRSALISRTVTRGLPVTPAKAGATAAKAAGLEPHPAMKDSGVKWLGGIPAHWEVKRLKYIAARSEVKIDAEEGNPLPYIGMEHVDSWTGRLLPLEEELVPTGVSNYFKSGDTLFGKLRPYLAKACNVEFEGLCSSELLVLRGKSYEPRFLLYQLLSTDFINLVDSSTYGSKMPRASWDFIGSCELTLPPLEEQQAIAAYLDRETAHIDRLIAKVEAAIERLTEYRHALITAAVTGKIDVSQYNTQRGTHHATVTLS
jgi:type I restriction enzyme S subunit